MDIDQPGLINRPSCEWVSLGDKRLPQERIDCYLVRGRYLRSEFTVQLLAAILKMLKIGFMRIVTFLS
jgi:hypothetical protein